MFFSSCIHLFSSTAKDFALLIFVFKFCYFTSFNSIVAYGVCLSSELLSVSAKSSWLLHFYFMLWELLCSHLSALEPWAIKNSCLQQMRHVTLHSNEFPLWPRSQVKFVTMAHTDINAAQNRVRIHQLIYSWSFKVFPLDCFHICDIMHNLIHIESKHRSL